MAINRILTDMFFASAALAACGMAAAPAGAQPPAPMALMAPHSGGAHPEAWAAELRDHANGHADRDDDRADDLYEEGRDAIEEGRYERAIERFNQLIALKSNRTDAALYWKAYSLAKTGNRAASLQTLADLQKQFAESRWLRDAKALEVEVKQASGQAVSPASQEDEELKLLALRGLMQSEPEQAFPVIEKMLASANSPKVKDRALFVLSQSQSPRARAVILGVAKGSGNPDLQLRAIRYLGVMGGADNRQALGDVYRSSNDAAVKRAIIRSFMVAGDREHLLALAKSESDAKLRGDAVRQLGVMGGSSELEQLYQAETSVDVKKSILQAMFIGGDAARLIALAKAEKEPELRRTAIHNLGLMKSQETAQALTSIYASDAAPEVRKAVINALFLQGNATALVSLARNEKDAQMKKEIVAKLSIMDSKEAVAYLMELLK